MNAEAVVIEPLTDKAIESLREFNSRYHGGPYDGAQHNHIVCLFIATIDARSSEVSGDRDQIVSAKTPE